MLINYNCPNCGKSRYFSSIQKDKIYCKNCNVEIFPTKGDISISIMTSEESRYLGDEALYSTVGKQIAEKRSRHFTGK